jgi:hypothetical protein
MEGMSLMSWNIDRTENIDGGVKVVTADGCEVIIKLATHDDGTPMVELVPQEGVSLEGEEPGLYYVVPA